MEDLSSVKKWYKKGWGITLLIFLGILLVIFSIFLFTTLKYWSLIRSGQGHAISSKFYNTFQANLKGNNASDTAKRAELETSDDPYKGNPAASIVVVEFVDFKCSLCKESEGIMKKVVDNYGHKIKLIIRDFPIESTHPGATKLGEIAQCAHEQNRYWQMHDSLFANQSSLTAVLAEKDIKALSNLASVDYTKLQKCLSDGKAKIEVDQDYATAFKHSAKGTPTFFINGKMVTGVIPYKSWETFLK